MPNPLPEKRFLLGPVYVFLALGFLAMYLGVMPAGIIGAACLVLPLALILEPLGERIPILKDYLGGSPLLLIFVGAGLVYFKVLSPQVVESLSGFMKESGSNFLDFFICSLITGAIFGIRLGQHFVVPKSPPCATPGSPSGCPQPNTVFE